jgi:hypothetical protein
MGVSRQPTMMVTSEAEGVIVIWFMGVNSPGDNSLPKRRRAICSASEDGLTRFDAVEHLTGADPRGLRKKSVLDFYCAHVSQSRTDSVHLAG